MLVKDYMTRHPIVIEPHKPAAIAQKMMIDNQIRYLPVVGAGKRLLGMMTRQRLHIPPERLASLEVWEITRYLSDLKVEKLMLKGPDLHIVDPEASIEEAAAILIKNKVGGLPVVSDGLLVGIITETDLLIELQELLGGRETGWRITVRVPDQRGEFAKLAQVIMAKGWGIMAMGSVRSPRQDGAWDIVLKVRDCTKEELLPALEQIEGQSIVDLRQTLPREEQLSAHTEVS